ncbi:MAG: DNA translocase FtsK [Deltaproteobacteria bacterium]|nr:MAG: DNA translocase FtsK [Deltaproteobacteria bacterium]
MAKAIASKTKATRRKKAPARRRSTTRAREPASACAPSPHRRELLGVLCLAAGITTALALLSYAPSDAARIARGDPATENLIGQLGHHLASALLGSIGLGAFVLALAAILVSFVLFTRRSVHLTVVEAVSYAVLVLAGATLAHLALPEARPLHHAPGGAVGAVLGELLRSHLNTAGALIVTGAVAITALVLATDLTVARLAGALFRAVGRLYRRLAHFLAAQWASYQAARTERAQQLAARAAERRALEAEEAQALRQAIEAKKAQAREAAGRRQGKARREAAGGEGEAPLHGDVDACQKIALPHPAAAMVSPIDEVEALCDLHPVDPLSNPTHEDPAWAHGLASLAPKIEVPIGGLSAPGQGDAHEPAEDGPPIVEDAASLHPPRAAQPAEAIEAPEISDAPAAAPPAGQPAGDAGSGPAPAKPESNRPPPPARAAAEDRGDAAGSSAQAREDGPTIVEAKAPPKPKRRAVQESFAYTQHGERFVLPSLDLLDRPPKQRKGELDRASLHETARRLTQKLADFGISGEVKKIRLGPVVTMYEFVPGPGVKISRIAGLADDLAMAMEALRVRIVAPLPGKGAVGIEVPNKDRQTVYLREILEQDAFQSSKSKLTLGFGKDVEGMPLAMDLAQMPHLLIAGTTGSGKSVSVNSMITSILYKATPDEVRFIMVDPKWTELSLYEGIPHLLLPVVKDPAKAALALRWAVDEMERRYQLLADAGVRGLAGYNKKVDALHAEWEARQATRDPDATDESEKDPEPERLPFIVIIIDELADLMMVASREVETYIARLAQKARAAGIHLMVATQRPSTDVLTGIIKANFPARIGFRVASRHDSQTIINQPGAEKLLGKGDMLVIPPGTSDPVRVHGAFVSDEEIHRVVEHLKQQGQPIYDESILKPRSDEADGEGDGEDDALDPKWDEALLLVSERERISVSYLQRRLSIGYNRAARMIERMEREGIVGPADGSKPREVLISAPPG